MPAKRVYGHKYDPAILEQVHCTAARNLSRDQLLSLSDCGFIRRGENILITGATGCGKSYLAVGGNLISAHFGN